MNGDNMAEKRDIFGQMIRDLDIGFLTGMGRWGKLTEAQYKKKRQGFIKKAAEERRKK